MSKKKKVGRPKAENKTRLHLYIHKDMVIIGRRYGSISKFFEDAAKNYISTSKFQQTLTENTPTKEQKKKS